MCWLIYNLLLLSRDEKIQYWLCVAINKHEILRIFAAFNFNGRILLQQNECRIIMRHKIDFLINPTDPPCRILSPADVEISFSWFHRVCGVKNKLNITARMINTNMLYGWKKLVWRALRLKTCCTFLSEAGIFKISQKLLLNLDDRITNECKLDTF